MQNIIFTDLTLYALISIYEKESRKKEEDKKCERNGTGKITNEMV